MTVAVKQLNVARAADRETMARQVEALVAKYRAWTCERDDVIDGTEGRELWLNLSGPHGLKLTLDLDGDSHQQRQGTFVLSWHGVDADVRLAPTFAPSVNTFHWHKATDVCEGWADVLAVLARRLQSACDGSAFSTQP